MVRISISFAFQEMGPCASPGAHTAPEGVNMEACLLYTSDAADERSSVDLGGRRIIKKKKSTQECTHTNAHTINKT